MPKIKTSKSLKKRFKITKRGKVLHRIAGQDHFNARESGKITLKKRGYQKITKVDSKTVKKLMPYQ